jgi:hypothetical protein
MGGNISKTESLIDTNIQQKSKTFKTENVANTLDWPTQRMRQTL